MSHPMNHLRSHKIEHSRVGKITRGYASGGAVKGYSDDDSKVRKMSASQEREVNPEGGVAPHRMDRPKRAKGGKVKKADGGKVNDWSGSFGPSEGGPKGGTQTPSTESGPDKNGYMTHSGFISGKRAKGGRVKSKGNSRTIVNVITGGHPAGGAVPPGPVMPPPGLAGAALPPPPMTAKPPMPMGGPPPGGPPPPGLMPTRARGGSVNKGTKVFEQSKRSGTKVSHDFGKLDMDDMNRKRVVSFKSGGVVKTFMAGGRVEASDAVAKSTELPGGSGGGEARLAKAHRAARK